MTAQSSLLLALDRIGTFAFALNGALTAIRAVPLDMVGVVALGMITALGGGILRDILLDDLRRPPSATGTTCWWRPPAAWSPSPWATTSSG